MDILDMHNTFRVVGQRMGIQLIRGILPESIDVYLNIAITDKIRAIVKENADKNYGDTLTLKENNIGSINALTNIYKSKTVDVEASQNNTFIIPSIENVMYYTSVRVNYDDSFNIACRLIENDKIGETLSDYCNKPSWDYPIATIVNDTKKYIEIYNGNKEIVSAIINYIENPDKVKWSENIEERVDCNLPEYLHYEIVELAVNKFFNSINLSTNKT